MPQFFEQYKPSEVTKTRRVLYTPGDRAKRTFFYIQEAGYLKSLKPHLGKRSQLDSFLFLMVLSGKGTICYKGIHYQVEAQDCFLLDCHEEYSHISRQDEPWELLWLHFNGPQALAFYQYVIQKNGYSFKTAQFAVIADLVEQLIRLHSQVQENSDLTSSFLITQILTLSVTGCQRPGTSQRSARAKLSQVLSYLNEHFHEPITLDMLSDRFFISKYHLAREFKKEYSQTIVQYLLNKRITCAKELLRFTDLSISETAQRCGIKDVNYFNKVFRKTEGCTASEFRRKW